MNQDTTTIAANLNSTDPFDVERLRLPGDTDADLGVRELLVHVPYRKPSPEAFFRVHPAAEYRCVGGLVELKEDSESYWVDRSLWPALGEEPTFGRRQVFLAVTRQGCPFLWGCRLPGPDGKVQSWVEVPLEAARSAEAKWTKLYWDQAQKRHRIKVSEYLTDDPVWPTPTLGELLRLAFKDRVITSLDHPILKRLRGEV